MAARLYALLAIAAIVASWFRPGLGQFVCAAVTVWFLGTQPLWRGAALAALITLLLRHTLHPAALLAALTGLMPFVADRVVRASGRCFFLTLFFPRAGVVVGWVAGACGIGRFGETPLLITAWTLWFGSVVNWMWETERVPPLLVIFSIVTLVWAAAGLPGVPHQPESPFVRTVAASLSAVAALALVALAARGRHRRPWALRAPTVPLVRNPATGTALELRTDDGKQFLASEAGERFRLLDDMPSFLEESDITGLNRKYAQFYDMIAGFYDTGERVVAALSHGGARHVRRKFLKSLSVRSGDLVLETSVGTGMNLKFLPPEIRVLGVDISLGCYRSASKILFAGVKKWSCFMPTRKRCRSPVTRSMWCSTLGESISFRTGGEPSSR
jgi:hypothetical protein